VAEEDSIEKFKFRKLRLDLTMEYFQDLANNSARPSLFEVIAQEQLRDLLQPALKYVLSVRW